MPLHHPKHRHRDDNLLPYRRDDDEAKPRRPYTPTAAPTTRPSPSSANTSASAHRLLLLFAAACFLLAAASLAFAVSARRRPPPPQPPPIAFRCGRAEDSLRSFLASSSHRNYSTGDREKVLAVVGVHTEVGSAARRAALRATWFPPNPEGIVSLEHGTGLSFRFVIGQPKDKEKMEDLRKEAELYHDFLFIDAEEDTKPPQRMLAFFKAAYHMFDAEFYVKADDDIYLRPDRLAALLAKDRPEHRTYVGCMKKGPVVNDPNMKWYESSWELLGNEYFMHASGSLYALSSEVVGAISTATNDSLRMFDYEDVTIGAWMLALNVKHENNHAMCDSTCTPTSIAVWDRKKCSGSCNIADKIKELHNTTLCSKSPTLPPEVEEEE
ncbi:probable beta-1,3-galactosyltransferase 12 [Phragmites australis]|uniref:probable beta-1,3-galactosyltransferase 12 n=1 Tax=Phragmites australis TaxID=29695 RepID=UPI002D76AC15|nr:probable beta-1,3-galactosyltransferase 12 [Phragmites australis]